MNALVIGLVGAESTGKTTLASALANALRRQCRVSVACIDEHLRHWCAAQGRTPRQHEQAAIAHAQTDRIRAAAATHAIVVADTTALMTAVYSEWVFGDRSLYADALAAHRRCDLTLLTALDLPWIADGLQRDGPQVRAPVDALLRAALRTAGIAHSVIHGAGADRLSAALAACGRRTDRPSAPTMASGPQRTPPCGGQQAQGERSMATPVSPRPGARSGTSAATGSAAPGRPPSS